MKEQVKDSVVERIVAQWNEEKGTPHPFLSEDAQKNREERILEEEWQNFTHRLERGLRILFQSRDRSMD